MSGHGGVAFYVYGVPVTQGSMSAPRKGVVIHNDKKLKPWREHVGWAAKEAWQSPPIAGLGVSVHLHFKIMRPKSHFGTGKNALYVRPSAPKTHIQKPDVDKLVRGILDALTGIVFIDDSQVYEIHTTKAWAESEGGVLVIIESESKGEDHEKRVHDS